MNPSQVQLGAVHRIATSIIVAMDALLLLAGFGGSAWVRLSAADRAHMPQPGLGSAGGVVVSARGGFPPSMNLLSHVSVRSAVALIRGNPTDNSGFPASNTDMTAAEQEEGEVKGHTE